MLRLGPLALGLLLAVSCASGDDVDGYEDAVWQKCAVAVAASERCAGSSAVARRGALVGGLWRCLRSEGNESTTPSVLRVLLPDVYASWLRPALARFSSEAGIPLQLDEQPLRQLLPAMLADAGLPAAAQHAVWLQSTLSTQQLADAGMVTDLSHAVDLDRTGLEWHDISQVFRLLLATFQGRTVSVPLDGSTTYTIYRPAVLKALGLEVPDTWRGLLRFLLAYRERLGAAAEAGQDGGGGGGGAEALPPYPLCLPLGATCQHLTLLEAIWSSVAQTQGYLQGVHFDPATGQPLLDTPAGREAFRVIAQLLAAAAPHEPGEGCSHGSVAFAQGRCALVLGALAPQMRMLILSAQYNSTVRASEVVVRPLLGSDVVWARGHDASADPDGLSPCTRDLCPYATATTAANSTKATANGLRGALVNHTPLSPGTNLAGAINNRMPTILQYISYELLSYLGSPDRIYDSGPEPLLLTVAPVRDQFVSPDVVDTWVEAGYDRAMMLDAFPHLAFSRGHPNRAWDLRMPGYVLYDDVLSDIIEGLRNGSILTDRLIDEEAAAAAAAATAAAVADAAAQAVPAAGANPKRLLGSVSEEELRRPKPAVRGATAAVRLSAALAEGQARLASFYLPEVYLPKYLDSLAVIRGDTLSSPPAESASSAARPRWVLQLTVALVVTCVGAAVLAVLAGAVWLRRRRRGGATSWLAGAAALCVTDIQDSTSLWEALPAAVMSEAVRLHHACVRGLLLRHRGYESSTEGDSFILSFATAKQAVAFALDLQAQLLTQPWPEKLLEQQVCSPVALSLRDGLPPFTRLAPPAAAPGTAERGLGSAATAVAARALSFASFSVDKTFKRRRAAASATATASRRTLLVTAAAATAAASSGGGTAARRPPTTVHALASTEFSEGPSTRGSAAAQPTRHLASYLSLRARLSVSGSGGSWQLGTREPPNAGDTLDGSGTDAEGEGEGGGGGGLRAGARAPGAVQGGRVAGVRGGAEGGAEGGEGRNLASTSSVHRAGGHDTAGRPAPRSADPGPGSDCSSPAPRPASAQPLATPMRALLAPTPRASGGASCLGAAQTQEMLQPPEVESGVGAGEVEAEAALSPAPRVPLGPALSLRALQLGSSQLRPKAAAFPQQPGAGDGAWGGAQPDACLGAAPAVRAPLRWRGLGGLLALATGAGAAAVPAVASPSDPAPGRLPSFSTANPHDGVEPAAEGTSGSDSGMAPSLAAAAEPGATPQTLGVLLAKLGAPAASGVAAGCVDAGRQATLSGMAQPASLEAVGGRGSTMFRGLRVRLGISWVLPAAGTADLQYNAAAARMVYGGPCLAAAKVVADMAHGGQVLLSGEAKEQLEAECRRGGRPAGTWLLLLGTYALPRAASTGAAPRHQFFGMHLLPLNAILRAAATAANDSTSTTDADTGCASPPTRSTSQLLSAFLGKATATTASGPPPSYFPATGAQRSPPPPPPPATSATPELRSVYWLTTPALSPRLALLPPPRVPHDWTTVGDVYGAPVGRVSYAVVRIPGALALLAWNAAVAEKALRMLRDAAAAQLQLQRGYQVPVACAGSLHAAFGSAACAVRWAEGLRQELVTLPWPKPLLTHELGEVVVATAPAPVPDPGPAADAGPRRPRVRRRSALSCQEADAVAGADTGEEVVDTEQSSFAGAPPPASVRQAAALQSPRPLSAPQPEVLEHAAALQLAAAAPVGSPGAAGVLGSGGPPSDTEGTQATQEDEAGRAEAPRGGAAAPPQQQLLPQRGLGARGGAPAPHSPRLFPSQSHQGMVQERPEQGRGGSGGGGAPPSALRARSNASDCVSAYSSTAPITAHCVMLRGLRMCAGVSTGEATPLVQDHTHALAYSGTAVRTAVRLAAAAASGQVLCDGATKQEAEVDRLWRAAMQLPSSRGGGVGRESRASAQSEPNAAVAAAEEAGLAFVWAAESCTTAARKRALANAFVCRMYGRADGHVPGVAAVSTAARGPSSTSPGLLRPGAP